MEHIIKTFSIYKLFGRYNVKIPLGEKVKILIGENGLGKTQILNILYYSLSRNFERLVEFDFEKIIIVFYDGISVEINKSKILENSHQTQLHPFINDILKILGNYEFNSLVNDITNNSISRYEMESHPMYRKVLALAPFDYIYDLIMDFGRKTRFINIESNYLNTRRAIIQKYLSDITMLYLPTYRRIEEDLKNLGYIEDHLKIRQADNILINFGMNDVKNRWSLITRQIDKLSKEGLFKISSEILSQLAKGKPEIDENFLNSISKEDVEIILARIGNQIAKEDKGRIIDKVTKKDIHNIDPYLLYFLQKLINIYNQQKQLDLLLKEFRDICNKYLVNKEIDYNESKIQLCVKLKGQGTIVQLDKLSSGEKQIISIFTKLYLSRGSSNFFILFDEPELSLSIFWQKELLPDIAKSSKCKMLFAVTHSPFIFENILSKNAIALTEYYENI